MDKTAEADTSFKEKAEQLEEENRKLLKKIERLKKTMEITSRHGDIVTSDLEEKVEASVRGIEEHIRLISETIPVPVVIVDVSDGKILYANEHSCLSFELAQDEIIKRRASELYENPEDSKIFFKILGEQGRVTDFETKLLKSDGSVFWAALFSQRLTFRNEPCVLTVIYDLTERKQAEEEIRRLNEQLSQKEVSYLIFKLNDTEYGIEILKIREIVTMMPLRSVMDAPHYIKGVIHLRDSIIPVADLRLRLGLGLEAAGYTDCTCIIVTEIGNAENSRIIGLIVDTVTEIHGFRKKDIEYPPGLMYENSKGFISGIAKSDSGMKILIQPDRIYL
ncbi:MAG: chemotaxis protein CheW [Desulfococcaceae bacterium]